jgi:uncharacterized protein with PIN domain
MSRKILNPIEVICEGCEKPFIAEHKTAKWCPKCWREVYFHKSKQRLPLPKIREIMRKANKVERCLFCGDDYIGKLEIHHVDTDVTNNNVKNLAYVCNTCHKRLHRHIYPQIMGKVFHHLLMARYTNDEVGAMFCCTKQNVNSIAQRYSVDNSLDRGQP